MSGLVEHHGDANGLQPEGMTKRELAEEVRRLRAALASWTAFLIVEQSDGADWLLHEVHPTFEAVTAAAETWMTTDRSHGGLRYTWVRIIERRGNEVLHQWRFDEFAQAWVEVKPVWDMR